MTHEALWGQTTAREAAGPQHFRFGDDEEPASGTHPGVLMKPAMQAGSASSWSSTPWCRSWRTEFNSIFSSRSVGF